ncbi:MAG: hypothetical protein HY282_08370 [Nitrospirae bacterium]|nr:hypothetical protein [Candidatus Manganitrophaceae bacterium]
METTDADVIDPRSATHDPLQTSPSRGGVPLLLPIDPPRSRQRPLPLFVEKPRDRLPITRLPLRDRFGIDPRCLKGLVK